MTPVAEAAPPDTAVRLLLALAKRTPAAGAGQAAAQLINEGVDWDYFLSQARRHRVLPLVGRNLDRLGLFELDHYLYASADAFRGAYLYHQRRNQALIDELMVLATRLCQEIPGVVVRKGLYLAQHVYRDLGVRPMADMDLLMPRQDTKRAVEILAELGYQMGDTSPDSRRVTPLPRERAAFWRLHVNNLPPLFRLTSEPTVLEFIVDISVGLFLPRSQFSVATEQIMGRAVPVAFGDVDILVPAPEDLLLDLCAHLYKESTTLRYLNRLKHQRLIQYCDMREVIAGNGDPGFWPRFTERVTGYQVAPVAYFALAHLEMLFPGTVPQQVLDAVGAETPDGFLDEYAAVDLGEPLVWSQDFVARTFSASTAPAIPTSASPV